MPKLPPKHRPFQASPLHRLVNASSLHHPANASSVQAITRRICAFVQISMVAAVVIVSLGHRLETADNNISVGRDGKSIVNIINNNNKNNTNSNNNNHDDDNSNNRTLVIIMGSLRGGEYAWHSMYKNLLDLNQADLALAVGLTTEEKKNSSLYSRAKYLWEFEEYDDWGDALDLIAGEHNPKYDKYANHSWRAVLVKGMPGVLGGCCNIHGSGAIIFWIRWFISNKIAELKLVKKYDRFVVTRSDHYYLCEHNLKTLDPTEVWAPEGEDWEGITDRHVVAPAEKILQVLDILQPILRDPLAYTEWYEELFGENSVRINPEKLVRWRWQFQRIVAARFPRMMFTCAVPGDQTRWGEIKSNLGPQGVHLKYEAEYFASNITCGVP